MNLKERGITVGDLLIIFMIILISTIIVKSFNKDKESNINQINEEKSLLITNRTKNFPTA
tara:strand:+ start:39 stop:218 length:180 start_codon:yes stop_codon:yes gene_type:complete